jgi:GntR family transcriptional regulator, transcriptional repressor for pyruvate dehydrogenase complex
MARTSTPKQASPTIRTSSEEVAHKLARRIFEEEFRNGAKLPPERELAVQFGVARNVLREAIKRLEAIGMLRCRHGSGVYVQDIDFVRGVSVFEMLMRDEDGAINAAFLRDVFEFRGFFIRFVVRLAAVRRSDEELNEIKSLVKERRASEGDSQRLTKVTHELSRKCVRATHNEVFQALFSTVERVSGELLSFIDSSMSDFAEHQTACERLIDAFEHKDPVMAELAELRYLETLERALRLESVPTGLLNP